LISDRLERGNLLMPIDPQSPVEVAKVPTDIEAASLITVLEQAGIKATATGSYTSGFRAEAPGWVSVVVRREDQEQAEAILKQIDGQPVDWSKVDVGKPE
jgi:hypothetical protein